MLNLPGVFALLTRYAPAPRVASPPPQGKSVPTRRVRSGVRIIYAPARAQRAKHLRTRFLSLSVPHTSGIGFAPSIALWHEIFCAVSARDMGTDRAAQRVMLMRMAQPALMPSPRCLDSAPAGMMQLCHRESVVQFINEVRCSRPYPPSPRAPSSGLALPQMSDPPTPSLSCTRLSPARAGV